MAEKMFEKQINYGWGLTLNMTGKQPAVSKLIYDTYEDAIEYVNNPKESCIPGLILRVVNDSDNSKNGVYFVKSIKENEEGIDGELEKIGSLDGVVIDCGEY